MKSSLYIIIGLILCSCNTKIEDESISINVIDDIVVPKYYIIPKTTETIKIDGLAEDSSWKLTQFTEPFIDIEGIKKPKFHSHLKMLWDDKYLYVYAELQEPHIWGNLKQRDTIIFYNNDFEVFIDPSGTGSNYGEIEINVLNTVWDLHLDKAYRVGGNADFNWNLDDLKSAVNIIGTINNPTDLDSLWTVEMAIPIKPLMELKDSPNDIPKEGEQWRINFSRVEWDFDIINGKYDRKKENNTYLKEYNWVWSNQKVINMHEPEKWGFLQFTEQSVTDTMAFIKDEDLLIKQATFALFRRTKYGDTKYLLNDQKEEISLEVTYAIDKTTTAIFNKTASGFIFKLKSPITSKTFSINQEGQLNTL